MLRKRRMSTTIALVFGLVSFVSTAMLVLLHQDATKQSMQSQEVSSMEHPFLLHKHSRRNDTTNSSTRNNNTIVNVPLGVEHFFWRGRQNRLVKLIRKVTSKHNDSTTVILLNFTIRCKVLYDQLHLGTGNLVLGFYGMRLAAATGGMDLLFHCTNQNVKHVKRQGSILTWLQGYYPAPKNPNTFSPYHPPLPTLKEAARGLGHCPLYYMSEAIRRDLRNMALQLVGPRQGMNISLSTDNNATSVEPLFPNVDMDDVAIHFRCGDVMKGFNSKNYGVVQYESYRQLISPFAKTIGIVTTSFNESSLRKQDQGTTRVCQVLVTGLKEYLQHAFPSTKISIRNGPNETLALAYARLVMANQTFCSPSTFSIFPAIASFGTSYIQRANLTYFVVPIAEVYEDVQFIEGPFLSALDVGMFFVQEQNETKRSAMMLEWLMKPFCILGESNNVTNVTGQVISCGNATSSR